MTTLAERTELLRATVADPAATADEVRRALSGANERARTELAKAVPPEQLYVSEGPSERACRLLAGLGRPETVVAIIRPHDQAQMAALKPHHGVMRAAIGEAALDRSDAWRKRFAEAMSEQAFVLRPLAWQLVHDLWHAAGPVLDEGRYLRLFLLEGEDHYGRYLEPLDVTVPRIVEWLTAEPDLIEHEVWRLFRVEGMGATDMGGPWNGALVAIAQTDPGFRARALDESLAALQRDFPPSKISWYPRFHRLLDPQPAEVEARQQTYFALLAASESVAVSLAQDMLARALPAIDLGRLIESSRAVLQRPEKKLVAAQLKLLRAIVRIDPDRAGAISEVVGAALDGLPIGLIDQARSLVRAPGDAPARAKAKAKAAARPAGSSPGTTVTGDRQPGQPVTIPPPRTTPLPTGSGQLAPISNVDEFRQLAYELLQCRGDGADLPRLAAFLTEQPRPQLDRDLEALARLVLEQVWDPCDGSPRRHLAARTLGLSGRLEYRGFRLATVMPPEGQAAPSSFTDPTRSDPQWSPGSRFLPPTSPFVPTQCPTALLIAELHSSEPRLSPLPPVTRDWRRAVLLPGQGRFDECCTWLPPRPYWVAQDELAAGGESEPAGKPSRWRALVRRRKTATTPPVAPDLALDVTAMPAEYRLRAEQAREQDGADQIWQWTAWLLQFNPDTLAAQAHPELWAATEAASVRGLGPLLAALGDTAIPPGGPAYSALALALNAAGSQHRAQGAEAVAALAGSGLLDPRRFTAEIAAHLADGMVKAGRLAPALADAASISAIGGARVLEVLEALLGSLGSIRNANRLVELAARLSDDFGRPVSIPDTLAARARGSSALAVAIRALGQVRPRHTDLAAEAAREAASQGVR